MQFKLPDNISPGIRYIIYGLMLFHLLIFVVYLLILMPNLLKKLPNRKSVKIGDVNIETQKPKKNEKKF